MIFRLMVLFSLFGLLFTGFGCTSPEALRRGPAAREIVHCFDHAKVMDPRPDIQTLAVGMRVQSEVLYTLQPDPTLYRGYKAALTNREAQQKFSTQTPIRGTLLGSMLLPNDSSVSASSGSRLMLEGDLMVRVSSGLIHNAESTTEAANYIDQIIPFIEIPDLVYREGSFLGAPDLAAINAGARYGVMGDPISVRDPAAWESRLGSAKVTLRDAYGQELASGRGQELMSHPLKALLWVRDSLKAEGKRLHVGDLVSLGSMTRMLPLVPGTVITATYEGLDPSGPVSVSVQIRE